VKRAGLSIAMWSAASAASACGGNTAAPPLPEVTDPVPLVDPTIGTGGQGFAYGSCFVGAAAPHGLVKVGPDTDGAFGTVNFQHFSGYMAGDTKVQGYSQVHLHGAGATDYGVLSVMPVPAFDPSKTSVVAYETGFSNQVAAAGVYKATLDGGIGVELTATQRVAVHRYTFPAGGAIVLDLDKTLSGGVVDAASLAVDDSAHEITGQLHHLGGMSAGFGGYTLYFVARASAAWTSSAVWQGGAVIAGSSATGTKVGAELTVPAGQSQLAIGISLVSLDGARANLAAEVPTVDFDAVAAATQDAWRQQLGVVKITGGTDVQRRIFYTSLYHAFLMPTVIGDADGTFVLAGGSAQQLATGYHQVSDLSLWDTYRTVEPLYAWLAPDSAHDVSRSLVAMGSGFGAYPKWPLAIGETGVMLGASAEIAIADAVARGVPDAGGDVAYPALRAAAMDPAAPAASRGGRSDVVAYMTSGYVPSSVGRSVSETTEYAHDDFALAQLAAAEGAGSDHDALLARSHGWQMLMDPATGFLRAKSATGEFATATGFDPTAQGDDYAEANAWQSLWMTGDHDPDGLAAVFGGSDATVAKLTTFFAMAQTDWDASDPTTNSFPRPYYWHGNEPDLNAVYVFAQQGHPELTEQWLRWVIDTMYTDQPTGVAGNDDGGTLGAWYVLSALGVYPVSGSDGWLVGAPRFPKARIDVGGHELIIEADGVSDDAMYVRAATLDGAAVDLVHGLSHAQLAGGSELVFQMSTDP
jgi:predicted alpha-1,2-mannosidase